MQKVFQAAWPSWVKQLKYTMLQSLCEDHSLPFTNSNFSPLWAGSKDISDLGLIFNHAFWPCLQFELILIDHDLSLPLCLSLILHMSNDQQKDKERKMKTSDQQICAATYKEI